jgi:hypothetical protein
MFASNAQRDGTNVHAIMQLFMRESEVQLALVFEPYVCYCHSIEEL